jgi:L-cysteine S-thiosulfotransferase
MQRELLWLCLVAAFVLLQGPAGGAVAQTADGIENAIAGPGDAARGRSIAADRESTCILCHQLPGDRGDGSLMPGGNLAPPLVGVGARLSVPQLRLRMTDSSRLNPQTIMPAYFKQDGLRQVAAGYSGRTILQAQQIEDLVAWLATLK